MRVQVAAASACLLASLAFAGSAGAGVIGLYRNNMESVGLQAQIANLSGARCKRGGSGHAFRIFIGKETKECSYRTPVIGRDVEIAATGRVLQGTPKPAQKKSFLALDLRAGGAARYQLALFPLQRKAQLLRYSGEGKATYLRVTHAVRTKGINKANELRLRAFNVTHGAEKGACRVMAWVGKQLVADVTDSAAGELQGRASGFTLGAVGNAKGVLGSFDDVVVRVPSPY